MDDVAAGIAIYHRHEFRRRRALPPAAWSKGRTSLRAYADRGLPAVFVPSLVNRAYILDLAEERSLLVYAAQHGIRPFLLDWGEPGDAERAFTTENYVLGALIPALEFVATTTGQAPRLIGYCMGGTLAVAPAVRRPDLVSGLALLAAPWNFHADSEASRQVLERFRPFLIPLIDALGVAPVDLLQCLFASLDPTLVGRKFRDLARTDPASPAAQRFVELEDWLNDGVPLAGPVAREVLFDWYVENTPFKRQWKIDGVAIDPAKISRPTLAVIPSEDRIVPPASALALAEAIPGAEIASLPLGHVGMMAGGSAPNRLYRPLTEWLAKVAVH